MRKSPQIAQINMIVCRRMFGGADLRPPMAADLGREAGRPAESLLGWEFPASTYEHVSVRGLAQRCTVSAKSARVDSSGAFRKSSQSG
jgi:hypothetical protein